MFCFGFWGQPASGAKFSITLSNYVGFAPRFDLQQHSPLSRKFNWKLVELKMLDCSDRTWTGISILTSAADFNKKAVVPTIINKGAISDLDKLRPTSPEDSSF